MPINFILVSIYLLLPLLAFSITPYRERMRDRMERLVILPFSLGCVSQESVAVATTQPRKRKSETHPFVTLGSQEREESSVVKMMKSDFVAASKPNISNGIQRLVKTFKSFSHQLFVDKEEMEMEIEIGFPTDVKHVGHIGWDGGSPTTEVRGYYCTENLITAAAVGEEEIEEGKKAAAAAPNDQILSFPSINYSLRQFELPCKGCPT